MATSGATVQELTKLLADHWQVIAAALAAVVAGGVAIKFFSHRQSGSSNYADQRNVKARGDVVGRDKNVNRDRKR